MGGSLRVTGSWQRWWWAGLRILMIGGWLVAVAVNWWVAPRPATYEQARADIAARDVVAFRWGERWDSDARRWFGNDTLYSSNRIGPLFSWRTGDGRVHWVDADSANPDMAPMSDEDVQLYSGAGTTALSREIQDAGLGERRDTDIFVFGNLLGTIGAVVYLLFLAVLVAGPAPALGTRWYWFWLNFLTPYGLGVIFWTLRERPWTDRPPPDPGTPRDRWPLGLLTGLVLSVTIPLALQLLTWIVGDRWFPAAP
ncbi:hypothetical protein [Actinoplanes couchii]|uniref:Uncharacterized protein n=1 Tax=Actinoplanes couchii TaxID=403638 RepID=A0ABQ3XPI7_9ACTN|nr:hypothetical protein [Actinoplanes couchii]MDR6319079.1 hypothetical protein [Actinoplanes couchii]GID60422.1 hypothetical protein Aco03nite_088260 [Actinoplanes couchii]